ncbi:methionyl-tRNA formyltransferase [Pollutibacter soli]|uniref:methionyl-tRNA formyltransferase n=1 Tax=Pollutibacter soli TaxID=3034157 RepID=UPI00301409B4
MKNPRIIFMGTPDFAVASLEAVLNAGFEVIAVVTAPDKPAGRGLQVNESAVKKFAVANGIKVLQPLKLKDPSFLSELQELKADLQIVVAFRMLPEMVWDMPPMGTINVHGSLLPQYRGAAPINRAIMNGETETGVTTFKLKHQIDTGDILLQRRISIGENETAGELHDRMKVVGADLLVETIQKIVNGDISTITQDQLNPDQLKHAPKIFTEDCKIDFSKTTAEVHNQVRGLSPFPGAFTTLQNKNCKIFKTEKRITGPSIPPGEFETDGKQRLSFACADGYVDVKELQLEGKKRMQVEDFLRGFRKV